MSAPLPTGYTPPHHRQAGQVMSDPAAQNLIADLVTLHETLLAKLEQDIHRAALGTSEPESGRVTGTSTRDSMDTLATAVRHAEQERDRQRRNALQHLRDAKEYYEIRLGLRPPRRTAVQSINYLNGEGRRVG